MRRGTCGIGVALLLSSTLLQAQQGFIGTYEGRFMFYAPEAGSHIAIPAALEITQVAEGKVTGKYQLFRGPCRGDYSAQGTYQDNKLTLQTSKGIMDCGNQALVVVLEGNKLVGKVGTWDIELSRK